MENQIIKELQFSYISVTDLSYGMSFRSPVAMSQKESNQVKPKHFHTEQKNLRSYIFSAVFDIPPCDIWSLGSQ